MAHHQHITPDPRTVHLIDQQVARDKEVVEKMVDVYAVHRRMCINPECCLSHLMLMITQPRPPEQRMSPTFVEALSQYIGKLEAALAMSVRLLHEERSRIADAE